MCQKWNTEHHGIFPVKIHLVARELHHIRMKLQLDHKYGKHWITYLEILSWFFSRKKSIMLSSLLQTSWKWIFEEHTKILQYYCL